MNDLLVDSAAAYRLTKLVTDDVITQPLRDRLLERIYRGTDLHPDRTLLMVPIDMLPMPDLHDEGSWQDFTIRDEHPPKLATLLTCRWCAGVWIAAGVTVARRVAPRAWRPAAELLTCAAAAALLARFED